MKILVAQLNPTIGDFAGNRSKIIHALDAARKKGAGVALFAEMAICGYPPEDLLMHEQFASDCEESLERIIPHTHGLFVVIGLVRKNRESGEKFLFDSAAIIEDGKLLGFHDKWLLPTYDVFDERRYFEPGQDVKVWHYKGKKIAVLVCEDIWQHAKEVGFTNYARDPIIDLQKLKPDVLFNLSASPYHFQKPQLRVRVCAASAKSLHCPVILSCQVGGNDELVFDGYSLAVNEKGELTTLAAGFKEDLLLVDLQNLGPPKKMDYNAVEDLYSALVLGTRDYFHKQGFKKGCLGLSGGVDSALVACIASEALGKDNVLGLTLPSRYSSPNSLIDAMALAKNLELQTLNVPIEEPYSCFLNLLEPHFQGMPFNEAEENMQARIRGLILMAISNKLGYIVLSTGNKSELAIGYCTLYGDMAGGLSIISDVNKRQVYELCHYINRDKEVIPQSIIDKVPTAELRPNQKDTDTLPEYPILDKIISSYVEEFLTPEEIARVHHLDLKLVRDIVHRIHLAEYKRRQAAPGIRVTKKSFRTGRRYPIVQKWK